MENFEPRPKTENQEPTPEFHFKEIAEVEPAMVSLAKQLKEKIENGAYDTLISDDVGGRIPTLILRKIIKALNPDRELGTFFIASGQTYLPDSRDREKYQKLQTHLKKVTGKTKKALIVTQFIFTGKTLLRLTNALKEAGLGNFDIATIDAVPHFEEEFILRNKLEKNNLYIGSDAWHHLHEEHEKLGGVRKTEEYSPFPRRIDDVIKQEGRELSQEEWRKIFGIKKGDSSKIIMEKSQDPERDKEFENRTHASLTPEEAGEIQRNINFAREDATLMANRVIKQVWGEKILNG